MTASPFRPASPSERAAQDVAPKRRGRPPGSTNRGGRYKSLRGELEKLLLTINMLLTAWQPKDALDPVEIGALASALDEQCRASPRFRKAVESLLTATGGASLIPVLGIIVARRAARHNILPSMVDGFGGMFLQLSNAKPSEAQQAMTDIFGAMGVDLGAGTNGSDPHTPSGAAE